MLKLQKIIITVIFISIILLLSCCDIIDSILGDGDNGDLNQLQEQSLNTVISLQDGASVLADDLFSNGIDTLSVIDSLANFFLSDTSVQEVLADSEGVAIDYKNGISGGIFVGRYILDVVNDANPPGNLDPFIEDSELEKPLVNSYSTVPINRKSIIFDGAYPQFHDSVDEIIKEANNSFAKIGIESFKKYLSSEAKIEVLSTLDQYGIIHLGGHGWRKRYEAGVIEKYVTYLMTGDKVSINTTFGDLWNDILEKNVIIVKDYKTKENRYWVSPKFVADRNDFHGKNTFIYGGFCSSARRWLKEMVNNTGAKEMVAYKYSVKSNWEEFWAIKMYKRMCDIDYTEPLEIGDCIYGIINEPNGYSYFGGANRVHMVTYNQAGRNLTFWENELLNGKIEFYIDDAEFIRSDGSSFTGDLKETLYLNDAQGVFGNNYFNGTYSYESLGRTFSGNIRITFIDNPESINIHLDNTMFFQSNFGFGKVTFDYTVDYNGIPYEGLDANSNNFIYTETGTSVSKINLTWKETNSQYVQNLGSYSCGNDAYINVSLNRRK